MIRIGNTILVFTVNGIQAYDTTGEFPPVTEYSPVSTGRLWVNTDFLLDWGRDHIFVDEMRTARPWRAGTSTQYNDEALLAQVPLDADGYPTSIPAGVTEIGTLILMEQPAASASAIGGRYRLTYLGAGSVVVDGGSNVVSTAGQIEFDYAPNGSNSIGVRILSTTTGNHIHGIQCYMVQHAALVAEGKRVNPAFRAAWGGVKLIRWMTAQGVNTSQQTNWADVPRPTSIARGPSWEEMVDVCNELGADGWFNFPFRGTADLVTQASTIVRDRMNPLLKAYFEYGNELWNWAGGFLGAHYLLDLVTVGNKPYNWMEMAGGRSTEVMQTVSAVFAGQMHRVVRVMGMQTGNTGLSQYNLYAPGWVAEAPGRVVPHTVHDAIAVAPYFSYTDAEAIISEYNSSGQAAAYALMMSQIVADIQATNTNYFSFYRTLANTLGKQLIAYEGGNHSINFGTSTNSALITQLVNDYVVSTDIVEHYGQMVDVWDAVGDGGFNQLSTTGRAFAGSEFGAMHHIADFMAPRYIALRGYSEGTFH